MNWYVMEHERGGREVADWEPGGPWRAVAGPFDSREVAVVAYQEMWPLATYRGMLEASTKGLAVATYSFATRQAGSADPGDYWWLIDSPDEPLIDSQGNPMRLVAR